MAKTTVLILALILHVTISFGQDKNSIDKKLDQCLLDSAGDFGRQKCFRQATIEWTKVLEDYKKLLIAALPHDQRDSFIDAQARWENFKEKELLFISFIASSDSKGLMGASMYEGKKSEIIRNRALDLYKIYTQLHARSK